MPQLKRSLTLAISIVAMFSSGCSFFAWEHEDRARIDLGEASADPLVAKSAAFRDTIGSRGFYEGSTPLEVRGFGLVIGLGHSGSRDCPKPIYETLVQQMYKRQGQTSQFIGETSVTPESMIDDLDTAVVSVRGLIPAAAVAGSSIDLTIMALPGTQTKSLHGGRLLPTELHIVKMVSPNKSLTGQALAIGMGRIFLNPFADGEKASSASKLEGTLLGGGRVLKDRPSRLILIDPSYVQSRRIQDRINAQYPGRYRVANATSPTTINLRVPNEHHTNIGHFLALLRALYLSRDQRFTAARSRELVEELLNPAAPHARIALCLEGIGRTTLPIVTPLYTHPKEFVSFHAAVAGLRLGDHIAGDAIAAHAQREDGAFRFAAIRALGEARGMGGPAVTLRLLLDDTDPRVRIAALEELLKRNDPTIQRSSIGTNNFELVTVAGGSPNVVYVRRTVSPRIALFGSHLRCSPPVVYRAPDGSVTATAEIDDRAITLLRTTARSGSVSPPVASSTELTALVKLLGRDADVGYDDEVLGLGIDYGTVVHMLHSLSKSDALNADFILEQPNLADMIGPSREIGRPESEL